MGLLFKIHLDLSVVQGSNNVNITTALRNRHTSSLPYNKFVQSTPFIMQYNKSLFKKLSSLLIKIEKNLVIPLWRPCTRAVLAV